MKYQDPTLRQTLAAEYALGALHGAARARFERLLRGDPALRQLTHEWQQLLSPLAQQTKPVTPPARVFAAIERRIAPPTPRASLWERLGFWRSFSAVGALAAVVLAVTTAFLMLRPPLAVPPNYVAILQDEAAQPVLAVTAYKDPWRLKIESLAVASLPADKVLQVWAVEKDSGTIRPLVAFTPGQPQQLALSEVQWKLIKGAHSLVASVETAGTAPVSPTTTLSYSGLCINLKGG
jgi:anti-sigma-K factor RskA